MTIAQITVPGAPDFAPHLEELLEKAGLTNTPDARSTLDSNLQSAWGEYQFERESERGRAPPELFNQLESSVKKTRGLLRRLERFHRLRDIGVDICAVGEGTVDIASAREFILEKDLVLPRNPPGLRSGPEQVPPGGTLAMISRKRMLDRLLRDIARFKRKRKQGHQRELDKAVIVAYAASFFRQFSTAETTTYFNGSFAKFCKKFYEVVTGEALTKNGLEKAIKYELKKPTLWT
jgi:hypothetical protein